MYKLLCGFLLILGLQAKAQTKESIDAKLTEAKNEILADVQINENANKPFEVLNQKAIDAYKQDGSSKNLEKILERYRALLTEIKGAQTPKTNNSEEFEVSYESIKKAKLKLCPLYPFCN